MVTPRGVLPRNSSKRKEEVEDDETKLVGQSFDLTA